MDHRYSGSNLWSELIRFKPCRLRNRKTALSNIVETLDLQTVNYVCSELDILQRPVPNKSWPPVSSHPSIKGKAHSTQKYVIIKNFFIVKDQVSGNIPEFLFCRNSRGMAGLVGLNLWHTMIGWVFIGKEVAQQGCGLAGAASAWWLCVWRYAVNL
jgi:hypothetical protein